MNVALVQLSISYTSLLRLRDPELERLTQTMSRLEVEEKHYSVNIWLGHGCLTRDVVRGPSVDRMLLFIKPLLSCVVES